MAERRESGELRGGSSFGWRGDRRPNGFRAFRREPEWRGGANWDVPPGYAGPGVMRRQEPLWPNHVGRGPRNYRRTDERIHEDVCERLTEDSRVDAFDIEVRVKDCEVTLTGNVTSREQKRRAEDVAALATGVRDVINELRVTLW